MVDFPCRGDVAYFDGLIETILAVGLVKPKQGMCMCFSLIYIYILFSFVKLTSFIV